MMTKPKIKVWKQTDRLEINVADELIVKIKPLSYDEKQEIQAVLMEGQLKKDMKMMASGTYLSIRYCLKSITHADGSPLEDSDGQPFELKFEENGALTMECLESLTNMEHSDKIMNMCSEFISSVPKGFTTKGVSFIVDESKKKAT